MNDIDQRRKEIANVLDHELTETDILSCITYFPEDEAIAIRLLRHIKRLEAKIEVIEEKK